MKNLHLFFMFLTENIERQVEYIHGLIRRTLHTNHMLKMSITTNQRPSERTYTIIMISWSLHPFK